MAKADSGPRSIKVFDRTMKSIKTNEALLYGLKHQKRSPVASQDLSIFENNSKDISPNKNADASSKSNQADEKSETQL